MKIDVLNGLSAGDAAEAFLKCCGSTRFVKQLVEARPFKSKDELLNAADRIWLNCSVADGLEAFTHHPKIGDVKSLEKKFASTREWAGGEQAGVNAAARATIKSLAEGNKAYEKKFGYIFIVCATGKTAEEMLALLNTRLRNDAETEIKVAMGEQNKITLLRLEKLSA